MPRGETPPWGDSTEGRPRHCDTASYDGTVRPERFTDLLTAGQAAQAIADGWSRGAPHDEIEMLALGDGGPGLLDVLAAGLAPSAGATDTELLTVPDPWGRPTPVELLLADSQGQRTAYLEAAQVCGPQTRHPQDSAGAASSFGVGAALVAALDAGAERIVVGLEGASAPDAGFGLLAALGAGPVERLGRGALALGDLTGDELSGLESAVDRLARARLIGLGELRQALLGFGGVAAGLTAALGAEPSEAQAIEAVDLVSGAPRRLDRLPGVGAGAGLGLAFAVLGAALADGPEAVAAELGLDEALSRADLLVTGTGVLGWDSLRGSPVTVAAAAAQRHGIPVVVLAGQLGAGRRETMAAGINGTYAACSSLAEWPVFAAAPAGSLATRAAAVARTWSPGSRTDGPS